MLLLLHVIAAPASAQGRTPQSMPAPKDICVYRAAHYRAKTRVVPRSKGARGQKASAASAQITLNFSGGFPTAAREALRAAADVWETHIQSSEEIEIDATWKDLGGEDALANAGPTLLQSNFAGAPETNVFYAEALANALAGRDINGDEAEIDAAFNSARDDWYFGSGTPGEEQIDFTSVAVHEIAHGLGFFGSMTVENGEGSWGLSSDDRPASYDLFTEGLGGNRLINTTFYPNPSERLADTLRSDSVFFDGPQARAANTAGAGADRRPQLYAPAEWSQGSSYSHLDEDTYPAGDVNSLMSPFVGFQEVIQSPGGIVCGIFADMGWTLGDDCEALLFEDLIAFEAAFLDDTEGTVELNWVVVGDSDVTAVQVRKAEEGERFEAVEDPIPLEEASICQENADGDVACTLRLENLNPGRYRFRLDLLEADNSRTLGPVREVFVQPQSPELVESYPNPFRPGQQATVRVVLRDDQETQRVAIGLYDAIGRLIRRVFVGDMSGADEVRRTIRAGALSSGVYFLHVVGEEFTETEELVLVR